MSDLLLDRSVAELGVAMRAGALSSRSLTEAALKRIETLDPEIHAFITVTDGAALGAADAADAAFRKGEDRGPMQGIPYALKDMFLTMGVLTSCNSKLLAGFVPERDAAVVSRLKEGGAVLLGKLTTHEFATGGPGLDLPWPPSRNPWDRERFAGGSSSGAGAAVAAGMVRLALGSDTGGSIRAPAGYCGVVGFKPTYGLVSRDGLFPLSFSLDHVGPLGRTVADCAAMMQVITGHDPLDPGSADVPPIDFLAGLSGGVNGMRLGLVRGFRDGHGAVDGEAAAAIDEAVAVLEGLGATVEEVVLPDLDLLNAVGRVIHTSEAHAIHERNLRARPQDYGRSAYARLCAGAFIPASDLMQALRARLKLSRMINNDVLSRYDGLITASTRFAAPPMSAWSLESPLMSEPYMMQFNVAGSPAMSLPIGLSSAGLPLAMQVVGRVLRDADVLRIGAAYEAAAGPARRASPHESA